MFNSANDNPLRTSAHLQRSLCLATFAVAIAAIACGHAAAQNTQGVAVSFYDPTKPETGPLYSPPGLNSTAGINGGAGHLNLNILQPYWNDLPGTGSQGSGTMSNLQDASGLNSGITVSWSGTDVGNIDWPGITPDGKMMNGQLIHIFGNEVVVEFTDLPNHMLASGYHVFVYADWEWFGFGSQDISLWNGPNNLIDSLPMSDPQAADQGGFQNPQHYIDATNSGSGNYVAFYNQTNSSFEIKANAGGIGVSVISGIQIIPATTGPSPCTVCGISYPNAIDENEPCGMHINDFCGKSGCDGHCGSQASTGCWCDIDCCGFGDCCVDQQLLCNECTWGPMPIDCGDTICGTLWTNVDGTVDIDRYAFEVADGHGTGVATIEVTVDTETPVTVWIDNGECPGDPDYISYVEADISSCMPLTIAATVPAPDVYFIRIEPAGAPAFCPSGSKYVMHVDVDTCGSGSGPANELCSNAAPVGYVNQMLFDNIGAVTDGPADPACGFNGVDDSDVWFAFAAHHGHLHLATIEPAGGQPDRLLAAYVGCPVAGDVPLGCSQMVGGAAGCVAFNPPPGAPVTLRFGTPGGTAGQGQSLLTIDGCPADLNGDGVTNTSDLLLLLGNWGLCPAVGPCVGDLNCDGVVDVADLLILLGLWGICP